MYPRLRPAQRGQTKPLGQRCAVRWAAHWASSPKRARNWLTVRMGFRFRLECFISDIISPFVRLTKLDIHLNEFFFNLFSSIAEVQFEVDIGSTATNVTGGGGPVGHADAFKEIYPFDPGDAPHPATQDLLDQSKYFR